MISAREDSPIAEMSDLKLIVPGKTKLLEKKTATPFTTIFDITVLSILDSMAAEIMKRLSIEEDVILERHANVE